MEAATDNQHLRAMYYRALFLKGPAADILLPMLRDLLSKDDRKYVEREAEKMDANRYMKRYLHLLRRG